RNHTDLRWWLERNRLRGLPLMGWAAAGCGGFKDAHPETRGQQWQVAVSKERANIRTKAPRNPIPTPRTRASTSAADRQRPRRVAAGPAKARSQDGGNRAEGRSSTAAARALGAAMT